MGVYGLGFRGLTLQGIPVAWYRARTARKTHITRPIKLTLGSRS